MFDPEDVPVVDDDELLARFIVNSREYRKDGTVKPQLFLPYKHVDLSVNRHRDCSIEEVWSIGIHVAQQREKTLHGRAEILASACRIDVLSVVPAALPGNPNHADVKGYPSKKEDQLLLATKLAEKSSKRISPPVND